MFQVFSGIRLKDYPGRLWGSRLCMGVTVEKSIYLGDDVD